MFQFLLIVQTLVAVALVSTILMQRSEGGGLGVGGSSSGFMTARGAADFLTRSTAILGGVFVSLSILLAAIAGVSGPAQTVDTSLVNQVQSAQPQQQQQDPNAPPLADQPGAEPAAPAGNQDAPAVPLAQ